MRLKIKEDLINYLKEFSYNEMENHTLFPELEKKTVIEDFKINNYNIPVFINEFWTSKQRKSSSLHEISYRACFKAQLPGFFIKLFTNKGDTVYDPFSGRGTTVVEAALLSRQVISNDINPISKIIAMPRLNIPDTGDVSNRLREILIKDAPIKKDLNKEIDLSMFYHPDTEAEIYSLRTYLIKKREKVNEDGVDSWIRMIATNRLTGHSPGFFSVYTLPPNQAVSPERQIKINLKRNQIPEYKNTKKIIEKKTKRILKDISSVEISKLKIISKEALFLEKDARQTPEIPDESVQLTVTSPPFLDVVQYSKDNWLRCWFNNLNTDEIEKEITMSRTIEDWTSVMGSVFNELYRITKKGGWVAFEVGEVKGGKIKLDEYVVPLGIKAGFACEGIVINLQEFTKTSNIWGVSNNNRGTNTNRIVLFHKN